LARFHSTSRDGLASLDDYVAAMRPGQEAIYTITGDNFDVTRGATARRLSRARRGGVADDGPDRRVLVPAIATYKDKTVQISDARWS